MFNLDVVASEGALAVAPREDSDTENLEEAAREAHHCGDFENAEELLEEAVRIGGPNPRLFYNLGLVRAEQGDYEGVIDALSSVSPDDHAALALRGLSYERLGKLDLAREDYSRVLGEAPDDVDTLVNLGTLELAQGNLDAADRYLGRAMRLDGAASWQYADVASAKGDHGEARRLLQIALDLGERRAQLDLALLDAADGQDSEAETRFLKAIEAGATLGRRQFSTFLLLRGRVEEALAVSGEGVRDEDEWSYAPYAVALERSLHHREAEKYRALACAAGDSEYVEEGPSF